MPVYKIEIPREMYHDLIAKAGRRLISLSAVVVERLDDWSALKISAEESHEIMGEIALGLAFSAGDDAPPHYCADGCGTPHLGPKADQAIHDARDAVQAGTWPGPPERRATHRRLMRTPPGGRFAIPEEEDTEVAG